MGETIRIEHGGKSYELKPKTITGELLDELQPIRQQQRGLAHSAEIMNAMLDDEKLFSLLDPETMGLREGVTKEQLEKYITSNARLMKAFQAPTAKITTNKAGRALCAKIIALTVDRSKMSEELKADLDSPTGASETVMDDDGSVVTTTSEPSEFWRGFDVLVMLDYVETFCERTRI